MFSNPRRVLSQCNTRLELLYLSIIPLFHVTFASSLYSHKLTSVCKPSVGMAEQLSNYFPFLLAKQNKWTFLILHHIFVFVLF